MTARIDAGVARDVAQLVSIHIYPVKSCQGVDLTEWAVDDFGLRNDRRWMFVDADGVFLSQRTFPQLARVSVALRNSFMELIAPGVMPLEVPSVMVDGPRTQVRIWQDTCEAISAGPDAARWSRSALGMSASLVFMPDTVRRLVEARFAVGEHRMGFTDDFPLLLTTEESLADLNTRMDHSIPMNRFRPNFVMSGAAPYAEDGWHRLWIGDVAFYGPKSCGRCVVTTTDQRTGERELEPLHTMAQYRVTGTKARFGRNLIPLSRGRLAVGAPVTLNTHHP